MTAPAPFSYRSHGSTDRIVDGRHQSAGERAAAIQPMLDEWSANNPEIATPFGRENLARASAFPSVGLIHQPAVNPDGSPFTFEQMWLDRFTADPDLLWLIVGDIVRYVSSEETPRGQRSPSRRKVQDRDKNLAAVWRIIGTHPFSMDPFPVAIRELIGERSLRDFATRAGFGSHQTLLRYISGKRPLTIEAMEAMAHAGRAEPFYFREYRAMWLSRELMRAMLARPNESVKAVKAVRDAVV